jgi:hypothetical protein
MSPDFVDDDERDSADAVSSACSLGVAVAVGEAGDPFSGGGETTRWPAWPAPILHGGMAGGADLLPGAVGGNVALFDQGGVHGALHGSGGDG